MLKIAGYNNRVELKELNEEINEIKNELNELTRQKLKLASMIPKLQDLICGFTTSHYYNFDNYLEHKYGYDNDEIDMY